MEVIRDKGSGSAAVSRRIASKWPKPEWHAPWKLYRVISGHLGWVWGLLVACMGLCDDHCGECCATQTVQLIAWSHCQKGSEQGQGRSVSDWAEAAVVCAHGNCIV